MQNVKARASLRADSKAPFQIVIPTRASFVIFTQRAPSFYAQARIRKFAADAACGPRGEQGKIALPYSIVHGQEKLFPARSRIVCITEK